jgi:protein-tyrosine phosphatase
MGYVDLHAHVLPGIDDGSPDLPTSLVMLRGLAELGYERITATPHQYAGRYLPTREAIDDAHAQVSRALGEQRIDLQLGLAAENMWDDVFHARWADASFPRYDGGNAFLFEVRPADLPLGFEQQLFQLQTKGFRPVMAHPERYVPFWSDEERLERLGESGCVLMVDLAALAGFHGGKQQKAARRLVEKRIAHAAATDVHSPDDVRSAAEGIDWIRKKMGLAAVTRLCDENPRRILAGQMPQA